MDLIDMDEEVNKQQQKQEEGKKQVVEEEEGGGGSIEKLFENSNEVVPPWWKQITLRSVVASLVLSVLFTIIVMKLNLTTGVIPSLNVSAGLLGYFFVKTYSKVLQKLGWLKQPFTRQENTVIQTCVVASSGIAFSGGFGSYLFGMSQIVAQQSGDGITSENIKDPKLGWMIAFLFCVSFLGLFSVIAIRKIMIIKLKLSYPSGTATANLINSFHTPQGAKVADKQVKALGFSSLFSFVWGVFQWLVSRKDVCGLGKLPIFGFKARDSRFYFDCSAMYVGVGMICPYIINISMLIGAIISWGIMWPQIDKKKGNWFPADLDSQNLHGLQGYKVFIAIAIILGDGLYNFVKILYKTYDALKKTYKSKELPVVKQDGLPALSYDDERRTQIFLKDQIPMWIPFGGYCGLCVICIPLVSQLIFPQLKWYYMLCILLTAPILGFCNAYGCGLTDWSLASTYGKLTIFIIGAWAGAEHGGVIAGLAACGVMMNVVSTASDLMQDFKTGYMTLSSPISMLSSQIIGTAMGCAISPCVFYFFLKANKDLGVAGSAYPAPYALIYRNMADLGLDGFSSLPKHCLIFCCAFFAGAIVVNIIRDLVGEKWSKWIPVPMAMAIPFYAGGYFTIDMCLGSLILFIWQKTNKAKADTYSSAVASGLICGDGIWSLPTALLSLFGVQAPFCIRVP